MEKAKPLRSAKQRRNRRLSRERASVEHVFARLAHYGEKCVRCIGLVRANVVIGLKGAIHTLLRLARLQQRAIVPVRLVRVLEKRECSDKNTDLCR